MARTRRVKAERFEVEFEYREEKHLQPKVRVRAWDADGGQPWVESFDHVDAALDQIAQERRALNDANQAILKRIRELEEAVARNNERESFWLDLDAKIATEL